MAKMTDSDGSTETNGKRHKAFDDANICLDYDVLIVGAGLSGLYSLHRMRQLGLRTKVLEAGSGEGGTWFW
jgi:ribulose 1,5-bisphosphate synthetase/thiazole synthase